MPVTSASTVWRAITTLGLFLIVLSLGSLFLDFMGVWDLTLFLADWMPVALLAGALLCFVGGIGWARHLGRGARISMAVVVCAVPGAAFLIVGTNVHGPGPLVGLLFAVGSILALVILFLPRSKPETKKPLS
jgi:hypothetical protein